MNLDSPLKEYLKLQTRRQFFKKGVAGLGGAALASMLSNAQAEETNGSDISSSGVLGNGHFKARAKRVIYLFMAGAPSQLDTFDYKPKMKDFFNKDLPESIRKGQRLTTMTAAQARFPIAPSMFNFKQYGKSGKYVSELFPNVGRMVDDIRFVHSMWTEAINHDPAITYIQTGNQIPGRPSLGAWLSYGLGSMNRNLPEFIVLNCAPRGQALYSRLWGSGFLPSKHSGVAFRSQGDPVLYLSNPGGMSHEMRRTMLDTLQKANKRVHEKYNNPETDARISQYEMAFRMQASVPDLVDISKESESVKKMYGTDVEKPGTFAYNCLLARRMVEKDVRFVQIFHRGWDTHTDLPNKIKRQSKEVDQPARALIQDLKQRGLLEDTLVVWGGEFGRTIYSQGTLTKNQYGRDHHPRCFTVWMAGGGIKGGASHGVTDDFGYNVVQDPVHIRDLNATIMHNMGIDHERFTVKYQGLDQRLTGVEPARILKSLLT